MTILAACTGSRTILPHKGRRVSFARFFWRLGCGREGSHEAGAAKAGTRGLRNEYQQPWKEYPWYCSVLRDDESMRLRNSRQYLRLTRAALYCKSQRRLRKDCALPALARTKSALAFSYHPLSSSCIPHLIMREIKPAYSSLFHLRCSLARTGELELSHSCGRADRKLTVEPVIRKETPSVCPGFLNCFVILPGWTSPFMTMRLASYILTWRERKNSLLSQYNILRWEVHWGILSEGGNSSGGSPARGRSPAKRIANTGEQTCGRDLGGEDTARNHGGRRRDGHKGRYAARDGGETPHGG